MMWVLLSLGSALFSGTAWVLSKGASSADARGAIALRSLSLLGFTVLFILWQGSLREFTAVDKLALWSSVGAGVTAAIGLVCFQRLIAGGLGKGAVLEKLSILLIALFEWLWFGRKLTMFSLIALVLILAGVLLMMEQKSTTIDKGRSFATGLLIVGTVTFTAISSVLAKLAVGGTSPAIALSLRTGVVLLAVMIWLISTRSLVRVSTIERKNRTLLVLSGFSAGIAWLFYFYALGMGSASAVHGLDKLNLLVTTASGRLWFGERYSTKMCVGIAVLVCGILLWSTASFS